ncbi:hypothetical protein GGR71_002483 [Xanthomonas sp. F1]
MPSIKAKHFLQREGGPIEHRLVRGRSRRDAGQLGLAVLQAVDVARPADPAQIAQVGGGDLAAAASTTGKPGAE